MDMIHDFINMSVALDRIDGLSLHATSTSDDPLPRLTAQWKDVLEAIGLSLGYASGCIGFIVTDNLRFRSFTERLGAVTDEVSVTERCRCIATLVRSISLALQENRPHFSRIPNLEEQLLSLHPIAASLDMVEQAEGLLNYLNCLQQGILAEYLLATEEGVFFLPPSDSSSPGLWHHSSTDALLQRRWDSALLVLEDLEKNPKATEFSGPLRQNLLLCANQALFDLEHNPLRQGDCDYLEEVVTRLLFQK